MGQLFISSFFDGLDIDFKFGQLKVFSLHRLRYSEQYFACAEMPLFFFLITIRLFAVFDLFLQNFTYSVNFTFLVEVEIRALEDPAQEDERLDGNLVVLVFEPSGDALNRARHVDRAGCSF